MPKEKVLVVDDDSAIRYTLTEALRGWGYEPLEASTVAAALESFDAEQPLAVLQDINLPDGSGLEALLEYKKRQPQAIVMWNGTEAISPAPLNCWAFRAISFVIV